MVSRDEFAQANQRAEDVWSTFSQAVSEHYDRRLGRVLVRLSSGLDVGCSSRETQGLEHARPAQLRCIKVSPSGFGIHCAELDADVYLPSLLQVISWLKEMEGRAAGRHRRKIQECREKVSSPKERQTGRTSAADRKSGRTSATV